MPTQENADAVDSSPLALLIVDDEALARSRLRELLDDIAAVCPTVVLGEAESGLAALAWIQNQLKENHLDVILADIHMPRMDGLELAGHLGRLDLSPAVIFTTAYDNHAVQAFELNAVDYLLKPVRAQRLLAALKKVRNRHHMAPPDETRLQVLGQGVRGGGRSHLCCHERGRLLLVPVHEILYFKADLKYVTARTREREYVLDETLNRLEEEYPGEFIRLHRSILIARQALAGFERAQEEEDAYGWALLHDIPEKLPVSRRQWSAAKAAVST
jgi:two-component system response regulator AlgR